MAHLRSILNFEATGHPINSPRSLEACLRSGYDPEELLPRSKETFYQRGLSNELLKLKFEHFQKKRQEKIACVRKERQLIISFLEQAEKTGGSATLPSPLAQSFSGGLSPKGRNRSPNGSRSPTSKMNSHTMSVQKELERDKSTMMELERKRLEALKLRQEKEVRMIMQQEQEAARVQKKNLEDEMLEMRQKAEREELRKKRKMEELARKVEREKAKARREAEDAKARRELARQEAEREHHIMEEEKERQREREIAARKREQSRVQRTEEHRKATEVLLVLQQQKADASRARMMEKEERLQVLMEEKKRKRQLVMRHKRAQAEQRINDALAQSQRLGEKKKTEFERRQQLALERAQIVQERQDAARLQQKEANEKASKIRKARLKEANKIRSKRVNDLVEAREKQENHLEAVGEEREKQRQARIVERELLQNDRMSNVRRIKRIDEFIRLQTLQKIQQEDERSERIKDEQAALIAQRRDASLQSLLRKHRMGEAMEQMRITNNWDNLHQITEIVGGGKGKKKKKRHMRGSMSLPNLSASSSSAP